MNLKPLVVRLYLFSTLPVWLSSLQSWQSSKTLLNISKLYNIKICSFSSNNPLNWDITSISVPLNPGSIHLSHTWAPPWDGRNKGTLNNLNCIHYTVNKTMCHCRINTCQFTLYKVCSLMYTVQCTLHTLHSTLYTVCH